MKISEILESKMGDFDLMIQDAFDEAEEEGKTTTGVILRKVEKRIREEETDPKKIEAMIKIAHKYIEGKFHE